MFHASRDTEACRLTSCLKTSGQTVAGDGTSSRPLAAARLARVHEWPTAAASRLTQLSVKPGHAGWRRCASNGTVRLALRQGRE